MGLRDIFAATAIVLGFVQNRSLTFSILIMFYDNKFMSRINASC